MTDTKPNNTNNGLRAWIPVFVAILGAFGGGVGANYLLVTGAATDLERLARPDPFTGTQGAQLEAKLEKLSSDLTDLRRQVDKMPPRELTERVLRLELEVRAIVRQLDKMETDDHEP